MSQFDDETENKELNLPSPGKLRSWAESINENFEDLDEFIASLENSVDGKIDSGEKGSPGGVAELSDAGTLRTSQTPDLAISEFLGYVASESELTTLEGERGDYAAVTEDGDPGDGEGEMYILVEDDHGDLGSWLQWKQQESPVQDVFGRTGSIDAESGDYSFDQIDAREHDNDDHSEDFVLSTTEGEINIQFDGDDGTDSEGRPILNLKPE